MEPMMVPPVESSISRAPFNTRYLMLYVSELDTELREKTVKRKGFVHDRVYVKIPCIPGYIRLQAGIQECRNILK